MSKQHSTVLAAAVVNVVCFFYAMLRNASRSHIYNYTDFQGSCQGFQALGQGASSSNLKGGKKRSRDHWKQACYVCFIDP
jgi:hypothetical protein